MTSLIANPLALIVLLLIIINIALFFLVFSLRRKLQNFLIGSKSENLGDSLTDITMSLTALQNFKDGMERYLQTVEKRLKKSVQSVETVRFNPFKGTGGGGNQSFATVFLNEHGDGVVISSLYAHDHVSVFAKPISKYASEHEMSEEEKAALAEAKGKMKDN